MSPELAATIEVERATGGEVVVIAGGLALRMGRCFVHTTHRTPDRVADIRRLGLDWCGCVVGLAVARRIQLEEA